MQRVSIRSRRISCSKRAGTDINNLSGIFWFPAFLKKAWLGGYGLGFTFWVLGCVLPVPIFAAKYYLSEAGLLGHSDPAVYLAGQVFLWFEWAYFLFITVALWNAASNHLSRAHQGGPEKIVWGQLSRVLALASAVMVVGSFANLSGLTELIFGRPMFVGLGAG